jgi:hypothetical protein
MPGFEVEIGEDEALAEVPDPNKPVPEVRHVYCVVVAADRAGATQAGWVEWDQKYGPGQRPTSADIKVEPMNDQVGNSRCARCAQTDICPKSRMRRSHNDREGSVEAKPSRILVGIDQVTVTGLALGVFLGRTETDERPPIAAGHHQVTLRLVGSRLHCQTEALQIAAS